MDHNTYHHSFYLFPAGLLYDMSSGDFGSSQRGGFVTSTEHKVKKPVPLDEIAAALDVIDRNTATGKRDYAMIMTEPVTGIRSVDIINLTFDAIDWINGENACTSFNDRRWRSHSGLYIERNTLMLHVIKSAMKNY